MVPTAFAGPAMMGTCSVGIYNSHVVGDELVNERKSIPPTTRIFPDCREVAVWKTRAKAKLPAALQASVLSEYISQLDNVLLPLLKPIPPDTKICPDGSMFALCPSRGAVIAPVPAHVPVFGLYSSELAKMLGLLLTEIPPPDTNTCPDDSRVAVCIERVCAIDPVVAHVPNAVL